MDRRTFLKNAAGAGAAALAYPVFSSRLLAAGPGSRTAEVVFIKTADRAAGVAHAIDMLALRGLKGKNVLIKPNFNSSDPTPGSTDVGLLSALMKKLKAIGVGQMTIGDRSGMGETRKVFESRGVLKLAREMNASAMVFDELGEEDWIKQEGSHWKKGFAVPAVLQKSAGIIQTCCLKTHRYGGHFTLSLKNSVGLAAKHVPGEDYNYMKELHSSPDQRRMIAEINKAYTPDLVVLDGVEAFVNGGPDSGKKVRSEVILAGTDRVAIDAVGVAILRHFGTTEEVSKGRIFEQEQIARAVELGLGVQGPAEIRLVTDDPQSAEYSKTIREILDKG